MTARHVLLLHGFTHTGSSWDPVIGGLGERYRALAPDIRGHGSASARRPVALDAVLDDLMLRAAGRFALGGYSMGGRIALHLALAHPGRVERLVLVGASPGIADPGEREARRRADEELARRIERGSIEEFARWWAEQPVLAGLPQPLAERVHADRLRSTPDGLAAALRGLGTGALEPLWARLAELEAPTTLAVGERDEKFLAIAHEMAREIPRVELVVVPGTGHAPHLEAPEAVAALMSV